MENVPTYISVVFALTTFATLGLFYLAVKSSQSNKSKSLPNAVGLGLTVWLVAQAVLTLNGFYNTDTTSFPPRFVVLVFPPLLTIAMVFATRKGRAFIDGLPLVNLMYINIVRIPVELVLYWLFLQKAVPELMTFAGRNFDILAGITAPFIAYYGLQRRNIGRRTILVWNVLALGLLVNIVVNALLSAPLAFQMFAFDQPNIAVLNFPFSWLPAFIVPVVLFGHVTSIRQLLRTK